MSKKIQQAMVLAAGEGVRMRPLTLDTPKPLLKVGDISMLDRLLDRLAEYGVKKIMVNACYWGEKIQEHASKKPHVTISMEDKCLDTGGGILKVLEFFKDEPFFVVNGDVVFKTTKESVFSQLDMAWDEQKFDALLLLVPKENAWGYDGAGDYRLQNDLLERRLRFPSAPYVYSGVQIFHPRAFQGFHPGVFSSVKVFDAVQKKKRLGGVVLDGEWYHFGTPGALERGQTFFREQSCQS